MSPQDMKITLNPAEEMIQVGAIGIRFLVTGADCNGSAALFEVAIPAVTGIPGPFHRHDAFEETIYGLEGTSTWIVNGEAIEIGPGQALSIPRGVVHGFVNHGVRDARVLAVVSPGVLGPAYFREVAAVIAAAAGGPPDRTEMMAVMQRHGLTPAPPPSA